MAVSSISDNVSVTHVEQIKEVVHTLQTAIPTLAATTQNVEDDTIIQISPPEVVSHIKSLAVPGEPRSIETVIDEAFEVFDQRLRVNHPRFMGLIPSPTSPVAWLGDVVASAFNALAASKLQASGPLAIEKNLISWLASQIGLPDTAGGLFVSGGSMGNLMAMVMARDRHLTPAQYGPGMAYVSESTHYSVTKALRIIGFKSDQIRCLPTDDDSRMLPAALAAAIRADQAAGLSPFVVAATCGTTNTGAVDPLRELAAVCNQYGIWLHIDGAYGASVALSKSHQSLVTDLCHADSISWDAHKWLFQTYSCGILLTRDKVDLVRSFRNDGDYLRDGRDMVDEELPNMWDYSMELTRPASRAMKLWFSLRVIGVDKIGEMIDHGFDLAVAAEETLEELKDWEIMSSARKSLAIITFRFRPAGVEAGALDDLNLLISKTLIAENIAGVLTTKVKGKVVLRICALNPQLPCEGMRRIIVQMDGVARRLLRYDSRAAR